MQKRTTKPTKASGSSSDPTRNRLAWNDFEVVLAIAASGSLSGAARSLGVSHATVFRRLGDIEQRLGVTLFLNLLTAGTLSASMAQDQLGAFGVARRPTTLLIKVIHPLPSHTDALT